MSVRNEDYDPEAQYIFIRPEVAKTSRSRTLSLSAMINTFLTKFLEVKPKGWEKWLSSTRAGKQLQANVLGSNFRKYCERADVKSARYQIRHSFATFYLENGGNPLFLPKIKMQTSPCAPAKKSDSKRCRTFQFWGSN